MRVVVLLAPLVFSVTAHAEERRAVTLGEAIAAAAQAPAARVSGHDVAAAEANVDAAGAWPSPAVHVATNRLTARVVAGATLPLPLFGTVGAAERAARAEADVVRADAELFRRELRHRVVVAWVTLARADGDVVTRAIAAQQAAELELIAKGRLAAGVGADVDVTVASAERARADVAAAAAQRIEDAASAELAGVLGWDPAVPLRADGSPVTGEGSSLLAGNALDALRARLVLHPERAAAVRRVDAAEASLDVVLKQRWPLLAVEGEVSLGDPTLPQGGNDARIGLALEVPLFARIGDKARAARATEAAQRARLVVTETELGAGLFAAYRNWQAAAERLRALERDVVPAQERAAALSAQAFREGARDLAYALQAERDLANVRAEVNAARAEAAVAFADLQLAVGDDVGAK